jgi:perosamine synthetase
MKPEKLAIHGGPKAKTVPYGTGMRFGKEELAQLEEALNQNTLFYWSGRSDKVVSFTKKFAEMYGMPYCIPTSSGTASLHVALGALGIGPGDEVITSPITDACTYIGILFQQAIPVFADLDPHTYNMTAETIAARITPRTKAMIVVHLAGNPCDMDPIMELARKHNIKVIEDCAQSYNCYYKGRLVGTIGDIGCFSTNDFKHISTGDGGMVLTRDEDLYRRAFGFADKNYTRLRDKPLGRAAEYLAPNYRMTELQGAVGLAQLDKLNDITEKRNKWGDGLTVGISGLPGIHPHRVEEGNKSSYWFYMFRVDPDELGCSRDEFVEALVAEGLPASPGYIPQCVYRIPMFVNQTAYTKTNLPFVSEHYDGEVDYHEGLCPVAEQILLDAIRLPVNEFFTEQDLEETIAAIRKVWTWYQGQK